jgi:hypothetical protein
MVTVQSGFEPATFRSLAHELTNCYIGAQCFFLSLVTRKKNFCLYVFPQVWRREKSLPNFYEKTACPAPGKEEGPGGQGEVSGRQQHPATSARPPEPSPSIVRYIKQFSEQRKCTDTRQSADSTHRYRSKYPHPKVGGLERLSGACVILYDAK